MNPTDIGDLLGSGKEAEVYAYREFVLKLYRPAASKNAPFREAATLAIVESSGVPAPKVIEVGRCEDRWGLVMTRAHGESFASAMISHPALVTNYLEEMARLHGRIHDQPGTALPGLKARLVSDIRRAPRLGATCRERLLARIEAMPDGDRLCHGDFHPWNIIGSPGEAIIVDWLDARRGSPAADVCRAYVLMHHAVPEMAEAYVETYAESNGLAPGDVFAWLPFIAAARLAGGVPDEEDHLARMARTV